MLHPNLCHTLYQGLGQGPYVEPLGSCLSIYYLEEEQNSTNFDFRTSQKISTPTKVLINLSTCINIMAVQLQCSGHIYNFH